MTDKEIIALYEKLTGIKSDVLVATFLNDKRNVERREEKLCKKPIGGYTPATWCETIISTT